MTIALTANISVPNINRVRITGWSVDDLSSVGLVTLRVLRVGGRIYGDYQLTIVDAVNGKSQGLGVNPAATGNTDDLVIVPQLSIPNGFTNAESAYRGAGGRSAAFRALEQQGLTDGWIAAALAGPVS